MELTDNKLYVVTSGQYSDYCIRAVFSTEEKAREYMSKGESDEHHIDYNDVEVFVIDQEVDATLHQVFTVEIHLKTGDIRHWNPRFEYLSPIQEPEIYRWTRFDGQMARITSSVGSEHAVKCAVEYRQKYLRDLGLTGENL